MYSEAQRNVIRREIDRAVRILGTQQKLGELLGISRQGVWEMKDEGRISGPNAITLDRATNGQISKHRLRPDLFEPPHQSKQRRKGNGRRAGSIK